MTTTKKNKSLKNTAKAFATKATKFNTEVLNSSEKLVDNTVATGEKVQDLMEKALQNGVDILGKQQELTLDTIENIVGQYRNTNDRFKKLISWNKKETIIQLPFKKQTQKVIDTAKKMVKEVVDSADTLLPTLSAKKVDKLKSIKKKTEKQIEVVSVRQSNKNKKAVTKKGFTIIEGIGPKIASILKKEGIQSFEQLAKVDVDSLKTILAKAGKRYTMHDPTTWGQQAELAAAGKWEVLAVWKKRIKGGKANTTRIVIL